MSPGEGGGTVDPTPEPEPEPEPQPQPQPGEEKVIFTEDFGTPEKSGNFWPNVSAKDEAKVYKGWSNKNLHSQTHICLVISVMHPFVLPLQ